MFFISPLLKDKCCEGFINPNLVPEIQGCCLKVYATYQVTHDGNSEQHELSCLVTKIFNIVIKKQCCLIVRLMEKSTFVMLRHKMVPVFWHQIVMYSYRGLPTKLVNLSEITYSHSVSKVKWKIQISVNFYYETS